MDGRAASTSDYERRGVRGAEEALIKHPAALIKCCLFKNLSCNIIDSADCVSALEVCGCAEHGHVSQAGVPRGYAASWHK